MNILDENIPESQPRLLRKWRIHFRQIGVDVGRKGMKDKEIIPLLHDLNRPTFFTRDNDFKDRRLCHETYCLVYSMWMRSRPRNTFAAFFDMPSSTRKRNGWASLFKRPRLD